jgi:hypothetical protein
MTPDQFNARHGKDYELFKATPMFRDLLATIAAQSPAAMAHKMQLETMSANSVAFTGSVAGFALASSVLRTLGQQTAEADDAGEFAGATLEEQIAGEDFQQAVANNGGRKRKK